MSSLQIALEITALSMGFVFAAIILIWWMIYLLTSLTADKTKPASTPQARVGGFRDEKERKARAAAVAFAIALAERQASSAQPLANPPSAQISPWQLGTRTRQMYQKGAPVRRPPR